ncbi:AcrR family transcriptional regulator [Nocardioides albus]|uniref:AcrR family transcriptional regulator n=1 Tax=Nocardioides albus TaxID=1841 RepID=A0A7W5F8A2_9ACTN|nr:TetR/AcrR family transcriptional regulator [Nocardioides albus]MBB3089020.1 AcrR family transcriptional regulator [Nocardioides albus]
MAVQEQRRTGRPPSMVDGKTVPQRILAAALELFAEKGFESTSVQDVVAAAGVTKGAMYHYFSSKEDLLYEIYGRVLRMQMERLDEAVAQEGPVEDRLRAACADVVVTTANNLEGTTIFFRSLHQMSAEKQQEVRRERRRYHETFRGLIVEGQESGAFRDDVSADLCVDYFFGSVHHLPMWLKPTGRLTAEEVGRSFAELFIAGLVTR